MFKSRWSWCLVFSILATSVGATQLDIVKQLLRERQYSEALTHAQALYQTTPQEPNVRFAYALSLIHNDSHGKAMEVLKGLTAEYPKLPEPYNNLAVIYAQNGLYEEAQKNIDLALKVSPGYKLALENQQILNDLRAATKKETSSTLREPEAVVRKDELVVKKEEQANVMPEAPSIVQGKALASTVQPAAAPVVVEKKSTAKSVDPDEVPAEISGPVKKEINQLIQQWITAWSSKNVEGYLSMYSADFKPPKDKTREQWEKQRRARIMNKENIRIDVLDVVVEVGSPVAAVATFQQNYKSTVLHEVSNKMLVFIRDNENSPWKIVDERTSY